MSPNQLADELGISPKTLRAWLRREYPRDAAMKWSSWELAPEQIAAARARWGSQTQQAPTRTRHVARATRQGSDEAYVIDLCDELLGESALRQFRFPWLLSDAGQSGARVSLPVDAYYPGHGLVIEYRERQHDEPVQFFDRRQTVSGVGRGEQRRIYDRRREVEISKHGLRLVIVRPSDLESDPRGRLRRNRDHDLGALKSLFDAT